MSEPCLYLTADRIGESSGGGIVTFQESQALQEFAVLNGLGTVRTVGREELGKTDISVGHFLNGEPWIWDQLAYHRFGSDVKLAHIYSGTFSESVKKLKANGAKVVYTVAAHSVEASRKAHADLGMPYPYNHLTDPLLWRRYSEGYWMADAIVVPSTYSERVVQEQHQALFGKPHPRVVVIPHGCHLPEKVPPLPKRFVVGYLGSYGADKGVRHLLEAWKKLDYKDATLLLAGRDSLSDWVQNLVARFGGGAILLGGWVKDVADFYAKCSVYCQPSCTEAFGIEVLEAAACGRPVICSAGAGAADAIPESRRFPAGDVNAMIDLIDKEKRAQEYYWNQDQKGQVQEAFRNIAKEHDWKLIRQRYQNIYSELLKG